LYKSAVDKLKLSLYRTYFQHFVYTRKSNYCLCDEQFIWLH